ncbi:MAG: UbiA family prenyltransferase [Gaiellaceae bacterium]
MAAAPELVPLPRRRSPARALLVALRPRQWSKNLLVFAGLVFAAKLGEPWRWLDACVCFVAYCAISSAAYLANDVRDREDDRLHPVKRSRPIARGELSPRAALTIAGALALLAPLLVAPLGIESVLLIAAFAVLQAGYTLRLKHVALLDVSAIAALFVVRAAAGAEAVHVPISGWLLLCTALLALFLALAKRRGELVLVGAGRTPGRPVLDGYSLELVDQLTAIVASATVIAYAIYTLTGDHSRVLLATVPFVVFGVFRYLLLMHRDDIGEEPEQVLLTDVPILLAVAGWIVTAAAILALG